MDATLSADFFTRTISMEQDGTSGRLYYTGWQGRAVVSLRLSW